MTGLLETVDRVMKSSGDGFTDIRESDWQSGRTLKRPIAGNNGPKIAAADKSVEYSPEALPPSELQKCSYWFCDQKELIGTIFRCAVDNRPVCEICYSTHIDGDVFGQIPACEACQKRRERNRIA